MAGKEIQLDPEIERLSAKLAKDPNSLVFAPLADAYRRSNLVEEAIDIAKRGLEIHPNYLSARNVLGSCYRDKRMYELAREQFEMVLERDSQNLKALRMCGDLLVTMRRDEEGIEKYRHLLEVDPFDKEVKDILEKMSGETPDEKAGSIAREREEGDLEPSETQPPEETSEEERGEALTAIAEEKKVEHSKFQLLEETPGEREESTTVSDEEEEGESLKNQSVARTLSEGESLEPPPEETWLEQPSETESSLQGGGEMDLEERKEEKGKEIGEILFSDDIENSPSEISGQEKEEGTPIRGVFDWEGKEEEGDFSLLSESDLSSPEISGQEKEEGSSVRGVFDWEGKEEVEKGEIYPVSETDLPSEEPFSSPEPPTLEKAGKPFLTLTIAEIYEKQGFTEKALKIYKELLQEDPNSETLQMKVRFLEESASGGPPPSSNEETSLPSLGEAAPPPLSEKKEVSLLDLIKEKGEEKPPLLHPSQEESKAKEEEEERGEFQSFQDWLRGLKR
ncbi:tetratricopeptide repeat protein [candidate division TA06 bacterium]|nr:tetratricopeptide repeat protein [candidate division TA06 bacterium]